MMTEEEARCKICPIRVSQINQAPGLCYASRCMFWRWDAGPIEYHEVSNMGTSFTVGIPWDDRRPGGCGMVKP